MASSQNTVAGLINLDNTTPVPSLALEQIQNKDFQQVFQDLQGNILKGHGRDYSANIFLNFKNSKSALRGDLKKLTEEFVTSAYKQVKETEQFNRFKIPGSLFGAFYLTSRTYRKLGFSEAEIKQFFPDRPEGNSPLLPQQSNFIDGMRKGAAELGDIPDFLDRVSLDDNPIHSFSPLQQSELKRLGRFSGEVQLDPLELAYLKDSIDGLLLLADDDKQFLLRTVRTLVSKLESSGIAEVLSVELGEALRNEEGEGIEHFGYVDGRSQPLYLDSDFVVKNGKREERINDKAIRREDGSITFWDPFAKLKHILVKDTVSASPAGYGSYFVFRKLEQDVLRFSMKEQELADALQLTGSDRERAGAMAVGRFRDGTPLTLSNTDGMIPAKSNNFRYDGLDSGLTSGANPHEDRLALKCPFQSHIRKSNPRHSTDGFGATVHENEEGDRGRAITRRGIPYGDRVKHPNAFQALDDLPTGGVGLLFACFQSSITRQYAFMQKTWLNNPGFKKDIPVPDPTPDPDPIVTKGLTGIDPLVGQSIKLDGNPRQNWRTDFGQNGQPVPTPALNKLDELYMAKSHPEKFNVSNFVKFRGGEFFFAPSISFLTSA